MSDREITPASTTRATAVTLAVFLAVCGALSVAPVPLWLKPFEITSTEDVKKIGARVFHKPRMTLAEAEDKLAGGSADGRDAPEGEGIAATMTAEERELFSTRDAQADVDALKDVAKDIAKDTAPARIALAAVDRKALVAKSSPKADKFREQARSVKALGAKLDNPCVEKIGDACARTALDPFFATLDQIARKDETARAQVLVLGNSLIASDHVTDVVRARLVERFGDAGRGFLLPDRLSKVAGRRVRTGQATNGWDIETFAQDKPVDGHALGPFGISGSLHISTAANEKTTWETQGATRARLFYVEHGAQPAMRLEVRLDKSDARGKGESGAKSAETKLVGRIEPVAAETKAHDETFDVEIPKDAKELVLVAEGKGARVAGVALERPAAGVVLDTIGVPAASYTLYVDGVDEEMFVRQVSARDPALVVLMLGGNEVRSLNYGTLDHAKLAQKLDTLIDRAHRAAPGAACLLVAPIDAAKATAAGEELMTRPEIDEVIVAQQQAAKQNGCAYFNMFDAMGGRGSLARFKEKGFLSDDLVHPTWKGGDVLGQLFADALLASYVETPASDANVAVHRKDKSARAPVLAGLTFPAEDRATVAVKGKDVPPPQRRSLARFFGRLRALERGEVFAEDRGDDTVAHSGRVAIGQIGASHTAGQMFTDRLRARLVERFGGAGRGFVSVGRESARLEQGGVVRAIEGAYEIADGREVVLGGSVGMSGTKARLEPGARFAVQFCAPEPVTKAARAKAHANGTRVKRGALPAGCFARGTNGFVQLAWLYTPDMGTAEVAVDGKTVARISPLERNLDSDVQLLRVPIDSESPTLEVLVAARDAKPRHEGEGEAAASEREPDGPIGPVHLLSVVEERDRPGVVLDAIGLPGTTGMTPQRWRQDLIAAEVEARDYDLVVTAWGTNEAGIGSLDEATYRHHFERTLTTLLQASPHADCLIIGASDRMDQRGDGWRAAPSHELVERVQRSLAAEHGCAFYSLRTAMGGPASMEKWVKDGFGHTDHVHFTREGYEKLADQFIDDLLAAYQYDGQLLELLAEQEAAKQTKKADVAIAPADRRGG